MSAMKFRHEITYDAPLDQVFAMLADAGFRRTSADAMGMVSADVTADGDRTVERFEGEAKVKVPLVGGKLESLLADLFRAGMDKEHAAGVAWLRGDH